MGRYLVSSDGTSLFFGFCSLNLSHYASTLSEHVSIVLFLLINCFFLMDFSFKGTTSSRDNRYKFFLFFFAYPYLLYWATVLTLPFWFSIHNFLLLNNFVIHKIDNFFFFLLFYFYNLLYLYGNRYSIYNTIVGKI